jgi:hypothetical protein
MTDTAMIQTTAASPRRPELELVIAPADYQPGVCNIGPAEIARRRRAGHVGLAASVGLFALLLLVDTPAPTRLLVALPAMASASGYLQARFHFCAGFGSRGLYNFGEVGPVTRVEDADALASDKRRSRQITLAAAGIGIAVGVLAAGLPV